MKTYKKILLLLLGILIITGTTYAWKTWGGVKWIWESAENQKDNRFEDHSDNTSDYGTWYYLDTYTNLKWQANNAEDLAWAKDCSKNNSDDNYCWEYLDPVWDWSKYDYTDKIPVDCDECSEDDFQVHKYCESLWEWWRVPTKREFMSIITDIKPAGMNYYTALPSISSKNYWSNITYTNDIRYAWYTNFSEGCMLNIYKYYDNTKNIICIHD